MDYNFYVYKMCKHVIKKFFVKKNTKYIVKICLCTRLNVSINTFLNCNQPKQTTANVNANANVHVKYALFNGVFI